MHVCSVFLKINPENLKEDWPPIHIVPSLDQVLSEIDHPDLFHPDYLKDLIQEDVTDL